MNIPVSQIVEEIAEVNVPVPQIVEEIAEVSKSLIVCNSILNLHFEVIEVFPASACVKQPVDPDLCRLSDVLVRVQFDAHTRLFSVVSLLFDFS